jgi:hypothetical protein
VLYGAARICVDRQVPAICADPAVAPNAAGASLGHAERDLALASSSVVNKWIYSDSVSDVVAEDHLTVEQCADRRNQETEHEEFRRTQTRSDVYIN